MNRGISQVETTNTTGKPYTDHNTLTGRTCRRSIVVNLIQHLWQRKANILWTECHVPCFSNHLKSIYSDCKRKTNILPSYLKITTLIEGSWGAKNCNLPFEDIVFIHETNLKPFHGFLLDFLHFELQGSNSAGRRALSHSLSPCWCFSHNILSKRQSSCVGTSPKDHFFASHLAIMAASVDCFVSCDVTLIHLHYGCRKTKIILLSATFFIKTQAKLMRLIHAAK